MFRRFVLAVGVACLSAMLTSLAGNAAVVTSIGTGFDTFGVYNWTGTPGAFIQNAQVLTPPHPSYFSGATTPPSQWVWQNSDGQPSDPNYPNFPPSGTPPGTGLFRDFQVQIDLTGFTGSSATLSGVWGADNNGSVYLNNNFVTPLALLTGNNTANFTSLTALAIAAGLFVDGINTLHFVIEDNGAVGGFRTAFTVEAIPIPPAILLFATALLGLGFLARSRTA
jgi:hypothetical protein